jgi:hypothetical protein
MIVSHGARDSETWALVAPRRRPRVGGTGGQHCGVVERPASKLEGQRIAVGAEATAHRKRWLAGDVEGVGQGRLAEKVEYRRVIEAIGRAVVVGRHH